MKAGADRKVLFALLGIAALCLIGLGASLYHGKAAKLAKQNWQLREKQQQLADAQAKLTELPQLEAEFTKLQTRLSTLEPTLPDSAYIPTFLRQIEGLAASTRNRILVIRPKPAPEQASQGPKTTINDETGEIVEKKGQAQAGSRPSAAEQAPMPYNHVPIELRLEGSYWTVIDFLVELQRFPKMIAVNDVGFDPTQAGANEQRSPQLTVTMALTAVATKGEKHAKSG